MFKDRTHAGRLLAQRVFDELPRMRPYRSPETLVVALPRGGVPVAVEVARLLGAPLTVLVSKKISAPYQNELAIGAVTSEGVVVVNEKLDGLRKRLSHYIKAERARLIEATRILERHWLQKSGGKENSDFTGNVVVIVDDGVATGMTTLAAVKSARARGARVVALAVPVVSPAALAQLESECDFLFTLEKPLDLRSVASFYQDFAEVEEKELINVLRSIRATNEEGGRTVEEKENTSRDEVKSPAVYRVVVAVADERYGGAQVEFIAGHAWPRRTQFHLVHVIEPNPFKNPLVAPPEVIEEIEKDEKASARYVLDNMAVKLRSRLPGSRVKRHLREGKPKGEILDAANELRADLIILGSHGRSGLDRFLLGSVADAVVTHAPCTAIIIRPVAAEFARDNSKIRQKDIEPDTADDGELVNAT